MEKFITHNLINFKYYKINDSRNKWLDEIGTINGQKGTVGIKLNGIDMPFNKYGVTPDIIMNPHAIPSRMSLGQLAECLVGKVAGLNGMDADGTPFEEYDFDAVKKMLKELGYEENGNEELYNGMSGEKMKVTIFFGPTYYQRLKHLVVDKIHCLTNDHDVLTLDGWKNITEITKNDKVATLKNNVLVYEHPTQIFDYPNYEGSMYHIKNSSIDLSVTGNHRMWVSRKYGRKQEWQPYDFENAEDIVGKHRKYKKDAEWNAKYYQFVLPEEINYSTKEIKEQFKPNMDDWLTFFGIWYAEGWATGNDTRGKVIISVDKQRVKDALYKALTNMNYKYYLDKDTEKLNICDIQLYRYMKPLSVGAYNKVMPSWVMKLNKLQSQKLINSMLLGDGSSNKKTGCEFYYTSSPKLANQFQQLCLHAGWTGNISIHINAGANKVYINNREVINQHNVLRISVITTKLNPSVNHGHTKKQNVQEERFIEKEKCHVVCLEVPSGVFYVRRNGKAVWTGNSRARGPRTLLTRQAKNLVTCVICN